MLFLTLTRYAIFRFASYLSFHNNCYILKDKINGFNLIIIKKLKVKSYRRKNSMLNLKKSTLQTIVDGSNPFWHCILKSCDAFLKRVLMSTACLLAQNSKHSMRFSVGEHNNNNCYKLTKVVISIFFRCCCCFFFINSTTMFM